MKFPESERKEHQTPSLILSTSPLYYSIQGWLHKQKSNQNGATENLLTLSLQHDKNWSTFIQLQDTATLSLHEAKQRTDLCLPGSRWEEQCTGMHPEDVTHPGGSNKASPTGSELH
jgi:hypothetical protein